MNFPPFPPNSVFFTLSADKIQLLNDKNLTISKLDGNGKIIRSKKITSTLYNKTYGSFFFIVNNWSEAQLFFTEGINYLLFDYGNQVTAEVKITVKMNNANSTINYLLVEYNNRIIKPTRIIVSSLESNLYVMN